MSKVITLLILGSPLVLYIVLELKSLKKWNKRLKLAKMESKLDTKYLLYRLKKSGIGTDFIN